MYRYTKAAVFVAFLGLGAASSVQAQTLPVSIELRGGAAIPTGDWSESDMVDNALGFGAAVRFSPAPLVGVYAGWDSFTFDIGDGGDLGDGDTSLKDSAFRLGAELKAPVSVVPVSPFVSAGLVYGKIKYELEGDSGTLGFESDSSFGFEGAVGVEFGAGPVALRPAVGYRTRSVEIDAAEASAEEDISYFTLVLGVSLKP